MSGSATRHDAVEAVTSYEIPHKDFAEPLGLLFGKNVFDLSRMKSRLPKNVYNSVLATIEKGAPLDPSVADVVAVAMKDWALQRAPRLRPRLLPADEPTAEKHDGFIDPDPERRRDHRVHRQALIQGEPDGSPFPNGGIRSTFEARGYTAWDVTSPAFVMETANGPPCAFPPCSCPGPAKRWTRRPRCCARTRR